ncbi:hypothetical protein ACFQ0B_38460 [Nonomuraea thailandensis]
MRSTRRPARAIAAAAALALLGAAVPAAGAATSEHSPPGARCSADVSLLGFTDSLDKTTFEGTAVGGLSALAPTRSSRALALVDNVGTTPPACTTSSSPPAGARACRPGSAA